MVNLLFLLQLPGNIATLVNEVVDFATTSYLGWFILGLLGCLLYTIGMPKRTFRKMSKSEQLINALILSILTGPIILVAAFLVIVFHKLSKYVRTD